MSGLMRRVLAEEYANEREQEELLADSVERDFIDQADVDSIDAQRDYAKDAVDTINTMESYCQLLKDSLENGGVNKDTLKAINISHECFNRKFHFKETGVLASIEDHSGRYCDYFATTQAIQELNASMEGMIGDVMAFLGKMFKSVIDFVKKCFKSNGDLIKRLNKINPDDLDKNILISFPNASLYNVDGEFNPDTTLSNLNEFFTNEISKGQWLDPVKNALSCINRNADKYGSSTEIDTKEILEFEKELNKVVNNTTNPLWKPTGTEVGEEDHKVPLYAFTVSDNIEITRGAISLKYGLIPKGLSWIKKEEQTQTVTSATRFTYEEVLNQAKQLKASEPVVLATLKQIEDELNENIKKLKNADLSTREEVVKTGGNLFFRILGILSCVNGLSSFGGGLVNFISATYEIAVSGVLTSGTPGLVMGGMFMAGSLIGLLLNLLISSLWYRLGKWLYNKGKVKDKKVEVNKTFDEINKDEIMQKLTQFTPAFTEKVSDSVWTSVSNFLEPYAQTLHDMTTYIELSAKAAKS